MTDPVKMYLREMGLVTLLSREGEVEIAKKIEAGEQDVLKALLETTLGVDFILELGARIENRSCGPSMCCAMWTRAIPIRTIWCRSMPSWPRSNPSPRSTTRTWNFAIRFSTRRPTEEQRRMRRNITRRNQKIFDMLKEWRLEGSVIDQIEEDIRNPSIGSTP